MRLEGHIVRIGNPWFRVPLWSVYFPLSWGCYALHIFTKDPAYVFTRRFWAFLPTMYIIGIDGITK